MTNGPLPASTKMTIPLFIRVLRCWVARVCQKMGAVQSHATSRSEFARPCRNNLMASSFTAFSSLGLFIHQFSPSTGGVCQTLKEGLSKQSSPGYHESASSGLCYSAFDSNSDIFSDEPLSTSCSSNDGPDGFRPLLQRLHLLIPTGFPVEPGHVLKALGHSGML